MNKLSFTAVHGGLRPPPVVPPPSFLEKATNVLKYPFTNATPKWMYPVFGAAVMSPIIGHQIHQYLKNKKEQEPEMDPMAKISSALDIATAQPTNMVAGLDQMKGLMQKAKLRAANQQGKGSPSLNLRNETMI